MGPHSLLCCVQSSLLRSCLELGLGLAKAVGEGVVIQTIRVIWVHCIFSFLDVEWLTSALPLILSEKIMYEWFGVESPAKFVQ